MILYIIIMWVVDTILSYFSDNKPPPQKKKTTPMYNAYGNGTITKSPPSDTEQS